MADIFISYSSEDRDRAREIAAALEKHGWSVWWDRKIPFGRSFDEVIEEQVDAARCIIVLWSVSSARSPWVKSEAREGKARGVLVPVLIEETRIPLEFRHMQTANLSAWPVESRGEFDILLARIVEMLGTSAGAAPPSAGGLGPSHALVHVASAGPARSPHPAAPAAVRTTGSTGAATLLYTLGGPAAACCLRFLPGGELIALWQDHTATVWRLADGRPQRTLRGEGHQAWRVTQVACFSRDGSLLATTPDSTTVLLWRVADGKLLHSLKKHTDTINALAFSHDGALLGSASDDKTACLWSSRDGHVERTLRWHQQWIRSIAFAPGSGMIATGAQVIINAPELKVWDRTSVRHNLQGHGSTINALAFSGDGTTLVSGASDNHVMTWTLDEGKLQHTLKGHTGAVSCVAISPGCDIIASASHDMSVKLWSLAEGTLHQTLKGHGAAIACLDFSLDGSLLASGAADNTVRIWSVV